MKVICIDAKPTGKEDFPVTIKEGEIYEVVDTHFEHGLYWNELSHQLGIGYHVRLFVPLSDIDESEQARERLKEVNLSKSFEKLKTVL